VSVVFDSEHLKILFRFLTLEPEKTHHFRQAVFRERPYEKHWKYDLL